jgi:hypothetical protein
MIEVIYTHVKCSINTKSVTFLSEKISNYEQFQLTPRFSFK